MSLTMIRHFYEYHFAENRSLWDTYIVPLPQEQFLQSSPYSLGSVRHHLVHMMSVDQTWFCGLRGLEIPDPLDPNNFEDRQALRTHWDSIEKMMRDYLAALSESALYEKPLDGEDGDLVLCQVLLHVVNHGTDHRAQALRLLNDLGVKTTSQDYIFYCYDHLMA
jgi:uncharacterized damage-inducible protein DinB